MKQKKETVIKENKEPIEVKKTDKQLNEEELALKKKELEQHKERLDGYKDEKRRTKSCDEEIDFMSKVIQMKSIEKDYDGVMPGGQWFQFESNEKWRNLRKELVLVPELEGLEKALKSVREQKQKIVAKIPELQKKINELEKKLNVKVTEFKAKPVI